MPSDPLSSPSSGDDPLSSSCSGDEPRSSPPMKDDPLSLSCSGADRRASRAFEDDALAWAAAHLPAMTDAAAYRAVGRLAATGVPPQALVSFLPRIATALRTGEAGPAPDPAERSTTMAYGDLDDPLLAFAADCSALVPEFYPWSVGWIGRAGGLAGTHHLRTGPVAPEDLATELRKVQADRFAIVADWLSPGPEVEIAVGCPTMRVDVVRRTADGFDDPHGPEAEHYLREVMAARTGRPSGTFRSRPDVGRPTR